MPALNFKTRFAKAVAAGEKTQTVRAIRKDGRDPKVGDNLYLYTGMRTKQCRKIADARCISVEPVVIDQPDVIQICGTDLPLVNRINFAYADGFASLHDLVSFFRETHGLPFMGLLIKWELVA